MTRRSRVVARVVAWLFPALFLHLAGTASAGRAIEDREHRYRLELDSVWRVKSSPSGSLAPLAGWEHQSMGALVAVSRIDYPNLDAWRSRTRDRYYDTVVAGIEESTPGYELMERRASMQGKVPALDLIHRRRPDDSVADSGRGDRDEVVLLRFLFFRRYALALAVTVPRRAYRRHRRTLRAVQQSFTPFFN